MRLSVTLVPDGTDVPDGPAADEQFGTPDATLVTEGADGRSVPDVVPRLLSPMSPMSPEYRTPDSTLHDAFLPSYFDKKRGSPAPAAPVPAPPLTNFHVFKQKSLNTIPAVLGERPGGGKAEELFHNFPFLTPLAHRKSSLVLAAARLSGCLEDEFYALHPDPDPVPPPTLLASSTPRDLCRHSYAGHKR